MTDDNMKRWIDSATYGQLLRKWWFATAGDPFFQGEIGQYYSKVMAERRDADPGEHVRSSKHIGWD